MPNFKCTILAVALKGLFVRLALNIIYSYVSEESYVRPKSHRHGAGLHCTGATEIPEQGSAFCLSPLMNSNLDNNFQLGLAKECEFCLVKIFEVLRSTFFHIRNKPDFQRVH